MTRRNLSFVDKFNVANYGDEIAFALAIVRRTQMEAYWNSVKAQYLGRANQSRTPNTDDHDAHSITDVEPL
jgi:hypothetical protein